jgi:hypothetical protein
MIVFFLLDISFDSQIILYLLFLQKPFSFSRMQSVMSKKRKWVVLPVAILFWVMINVLMKPIDAAYVGLIRSTTTLTGINFDIVLAMVYVSITAILFLKAIRKPSAATS